MTHLKHENLGYPTTVEITKWGACSPGRPSLRCPEPMSKITARVPAVVASAIPRRTVLSLAAAAGTERRRDVLDPPVATRHRSAELTVLRSCAGSAASSGSRRCLCLEAKLGVLTAQINYSRESMDFFFRPSGTEEGRLQ